MEKNPEIGFNLAPQTRVEQEVADYFRSIGPVIKGKRSRQIVVGITVQADSRPTSSKLRRKPSLEEKAIGIFAQRLGFDLDEEVPVSVDWDEQGRKPFKMETRSLNSTLHPELKLIQRQKFSVTDQDPLGTQKPQSIGYFLEHHSEKS